jgi:hypothetical protein
MTQKHRDPVLAHLGLLDTEPAMLRAAEHARRVAIQTGTPLVLWRDGRVVLVDPESVVLPTSPTTRVRESHQTQP